MLPNMFLQYLSLGVDLLLFFFLVYYAFHLNKKEKELDQERAKMDQTYHHVVDDAMSKERQIISDATSEADRILLDTQLFSESSETSIDKTLETLIANLKKDSTNTAKIYHDAYHLTLKQVSDQSIKDFQTISHGMQDTLKKQLASFHETLLPVMEKELAAYKQARMLETEHEIKNIVHAVSQELLNKSIPVEDHEKLLLESLERAKQKGMFA